MDKGEICCEGAESSKDLKYNVKDLTEQGKKYEVRFYHTVIEENNETEGGIEPVEEEKTITETNRMLTDQSKPFINIEPELTTTIEYYEPEKKDKKNRFKQFFFCCF